MKFNVNDIELIISKEPGIYELGGASATGKSYLAELLKTAKILGIKTCVIDELGRENDVDRDADLVFVDRYDYIKSKELFEKLISLNCIVLVDCKHSCELDIHAERARILLEEDRITVL